MAIRTQDGISKKALWGATAFYLLIAFEIMYMAGPFAIYFYGVYNPVLHFFAEFPALSDLNMFFFPHVARETRSAFFAVHEVIGFSLAALGFGAFLIGAGQIYYSKFTRRGAVTGGVYNHIRHPQYLAFAVCGFGLLLAWPRIVNLLMFVTMLFVYYLLAKAEERECEARFGQSYIDYKSRTTMFFPFRLLALPSLPKAGGKRAVLLACLYLGAMTSALFAAKAMTSYSIDSLYAVYTKDAAIISLAAIEHDKLQEVVNIAAMDKKVVERLERAKNSRYVGYVLPTEWYATEVPMNGIAHQTDVPHLSPAAYDNTRYKVIFTAVQCDGNPAGKDILTSVREREPLAEVWVDLMEHRVTRILDIPVDYKYRGIPVPVY